MPVYGLRFAEHPDYDRRFGGTPLYGEAYGISAEYVEAGWELHATGFIRDPLLPDSVEQGDGAAVYAETRVTPATSLGLEAMFVKDHDDERSLPTSRSRAASHGSPISCDPGGKLNQGVEDSGNDSIIRSTPNQDAGCSRASRWIGSMSDRR
jgi:hypothetical protein